MLDVAKTKRVEAMQRLQKINEKQKLLEKAIPSQEATKTKAGASGNSEGCSKKEGQKITYTRMHACMDEHTHARILARLYVRTHVYIHTCIHTCASTHVCPGI